MLRSVFALVLAPWCLANCTFDSHPTWTALSDEPMPKAWAPRSPEDAAVRGAMLGELPPRAASANVHQPVASASPKSEGNAGTAAAATPSAALEDLDAGPEAHDSGLDAAISGDAAQQKPADPPPAPVDEEAGKRLVRSFVEAVSKAFHGPGKNENNDLKRWSKDARRSARLTAQVVTPGLAALTQSALCFARPSECADVCYLIERDCEPCSSDDACRALLRQVCGGLPGGICQP